MWEEDAGVNPLADANDHSLPDRGWKDGAVSGPVRDTLSRYRLVRRLSALFDVTLGPLALLAVSLLIIELLVRLDPPWNRIVYATQIGIWAIFLIAFAVELALAPKKRLYLRRNWLLVIALVVPSLRVLRAARSLQFLRTARVVRGTSVVRGFTSLRRGTEAVRSFLGFSQLAFLAAITVMVWLAASGLVYFLEANTASEIDSVSDAMWWSATVLTTVGISMEPVSAEGRIVAIALRVFGVAVIGYFTARMAAFFFGRRKDGDPSDASPATSAEVHALREEIAHLRRELQDRDG
jgi:voltage-gated potassium channel